MHPYYIQQLFQELKKQSEKLSQMERTLQDLRKDVDVVMNKNHTHIDRIDYHFDLLKIEKLEGTLNIGLTSSPGKTLDDIMVNGQSMGQIQTDPERAELISNIQQTIHTYLDQEVPQFIEMIARDRDIQIDPKYIQMIIQDIQGQIDARIILYVDQMIEKTQNHFDAKASQNTITHQVKQEINTAIQQHIERKYSGKQESNETKHNE